MPRIYLDHNATTPLRPEARAAMLPVLGENFGNPSSTHGGGAEARDAIAAARAQLASLLGVAPATLISTSGGWQRRASPGISCR